MHSCIECAPEGTKAPRAPVRGKRRVLEGGRGRTKDRVRSNPGVMMRRTRVRERVSGTDERSRKVQLRGDDEKDERAAERMQEERGDAVLLNELPDRAPSGISCLHSI